MLLRRCESTPAASPIIVSLDSFIPFFVSPFSSKLVLVCLHPSIHPLTPFICPTPYSQFLLFYPLSPCANASHWYLLALLQSTRKARIIWQTKQAWSCLGHTEKLRGALAHWHSSWKYIITQSPGLWCWLIWIPYMRSGYAVTWLGYGTVPLPSRHWFRSNKLLHGHGGASPTCSPAQTPTWMWS